MSNLYDKKIFELRDKIEKWDKEDVRELSYNIRELCSLCENVPEEFDIGYDVDEIIDLDNLPSNDIIKKYDKDRLYSKGGGIAAIDNKGFALMEPGYSDIYHIDELKELLK